MTTTAQLDAFGFIRVSTGSQDAQTQRTRITSHATASGINLVDILDAGTASASKGEQIDELDNLISRLRAGEASAVLVTETNRLDRREDLDSQIRTLMEIKATGAVIISLKKGEEDFGKNDPIAWQFTIGRMIANAEKSLTVKYETWGGVQGIIANKSSYGQLPVFWEATGERYHKQAVCTSPEAVRAAYEAARDGRSIASIARDNGVWPQSIRNLLRERANMTGVFECRYTYDGQTYTWEHAVSAVVDQELWHAANRVMDQQQETGRRNLGGRPITLAKSWISGLLDCPRCGGHLYVLRGTTLRCAGRGKDRRSCGVSGINLARVTEQIEAIVVRDDVPVYRYQRVSGNQGELDELRNELERFNSMSLTSIPRSERGAHLDRIADLEDAIGAFELVLDAYRMEPTYVTIEDGTPCDASYGRKRSETLADLWRGGDKREIFKALQRYLKFYFLLDESGHVINQVWQRDIADYPGGVLIELSDDTCVRFPTVDEAYRREVPVTA